MKKPIRIAVVDDHIMVREGFISRLKENEELEVVLDAGNGIELLEKLKKRTVDVVLLDLEMPEMDGFETTQKLSQKYPNIKTIIVSSHNEEAFINHLLKNGARGFILKENGSETLVDAIYSVMETGYYFNDRISKAMLNGLIKSDTVKPSFNKADLTPREIEIIQLMSKEHTTREIAEKLFVSIRTIDGHRERIFEKTKARNAIGIIMYAVKHNLLE